MLNYYGSIYPMIDVEVTLRCNWNCKNCIRFCSREKELGLDYSDSDMSIGQIKNFIKQVKEIAIKTRRQVADIVCISGGEPLLHPKVVEITLLIKEKLVDSGCIGSVVVNSNLVVPAPEKIKKYIVNFSDTDTKLKIHRAVLLHPDDQKVPRPTFNSCEGYPPNRTKVVLNKHGYTRCCHSDGYIRLFCEQDLISDVLPSDKNFLLDKLDKICQHCTFGLKDAKLEKDVGSPISKIYQDQADLNKAGRKIEKIFPSID
jgi:hypothetical protein